MKGRWDRQIPWTTDLLGLEIKKQIPALVALRSLCSLLCLPQQRYRRRGGELEGGEGRAVGDGEGRGMKMVGGEGMGMAEEAGRRTILVAVLLVCFLDIKFGTILLRLVDNTWRSNTKGVVRWDGNCIDKQEKVRGIDNKEVSK
jgi:hypothetical protein